MTRTAKLLCAIACALLLVTAVFHSLDYVQVYNAVEKSITSEFFRNTLPGLWLHFSVHLVVLFAFGILALRSAYGTRRLLGLLALAITVDTVFVLFFAGFFSGVALLAVAAICFTLAAFLSPLSREPQLDESNIEQDVL